MTEKLQIELVEAALAGDIDSFGRLARRYYASMDKFAPWLAQICRNVARDMVAAKARQINMEDSCRVSDSSGRDDNVEAVRRSIEQLPLRSREVIVLRYYNGLSYEEIASVLGISKPTINGRLTRAKRKMARYLKSNGFPES
ncbi:MAG: RNA polymerase sigma factor [Planctomycetota bacterium]|jgi:RNA polymerase sigma-70 factor (ECF subfamily)